LFVHSCYFFTTFPPQKLSKVDSPKSPFYRPTETHFQRVQNAVLRSIHRANYSRLDSSHDVETTVIPSPGEFLMKYSVGTPPFQILGSWYWLQHHLDAMSTL